MKNLRFLLLGILFGIILTKTEAVSWFRIQEMFRFQSIHMFGLLGTAIPTAMLGLWLIRKFNLKTIDSEAIMIPEKKFYRYKYLFGGIIFGLGWALTGACPGPIYAIIGNGNSVFIIVLLSAMVGVLLHNLIKDKLPQ